VTAPQGSGASGAQRVHIDTDPGLDDLLALGLALASPELHVVGLTTVAGNASLEAVTENARRFLALAGVELPVGAGAAGPLALSRVHAEHVHGPDGRQGIPLGEPSQGGALPGLEVLCHSLREGRAGRIIALGPLTNVATLLRESPALLDGVELVWMGGTLGAGNVTPLAEFNAYADPEAARVVLGSGRRVRIVGLEVTRQVRLHERELEAAGASFGAGRLGRGLEMIARALVRAEVAEGAGGEPRATLHDPCAIAAATHPELFRFEERAIDVRATEGPERGRLVEKPAARGAPILYAVEVDAPAVLGLFLERLASWSRAPRAAARA
jgi:inosine-uridine nucleoside N-ribohydrolase